MHWSHVVVLNGQDKIQNDYFAIINFARSRSNVISKCFSEIFVIFLFENNLTLLKNKKAILKRKQHNFFRGRNKKFKSDSDPNNPTG